MKMYASLLLCSIAFVVACPVVSFAQDTSAAKLVVADSSAAIMAVQDSVPKTIPQKKSRKRIILRPAGDFDQRFSFIDNQGVSIWGYRIGAAVNDIYKVGIGGYFLKQELAGIKLDADGLPINRLTKSLYYGTIYYEPFLFRRKRWEMSMVFELGYGKAVLDSTNKIRGRFLTKTEEQIFVPAGMGYSVNFIIPDIKGLHFLTYLGLNGMIGLRKAVFESDLKYNFDGWYWSIGSAVFIDKIFADIAGKKKKAKPDQP